MTTGEFIGDVASGGLLARSVEPRAGEHGAEAGHTHESACLNCGTPLVGPHCHLCGQGSHVHRTLGAFFHDLLHGAFHFEGKIWRTLPALLLRPGKLTREYIDGRRASYISPIALFLFSAFLLYATIHVFESGEPTVGARSMDAGINTAAAELQASRTKLAKATDPDAKAALQKQVADHQGELDALRQLKASGVTVGNFGRDKVTSDIPWIDEGVARFRDNPDLAIYKLQTSAYKYSWLLIPLSAPFVWLLFPFSRRFNIYDHTVFVTYSLSAMTLLGVVLTAANALGAESLTGILLCLPPVHMYRQLRGTYGVSRTGAALRTFALLSFALTALILFMLILLAAMG